MNPIIKTAIPIFLLTQVGNAAIVVDGYSKGESIAACIIRACIVAVLSILGSVIVSSLIMNLIGDPLLERNTESRTLPRKKINWGYYALVLVGVSVFLILLVAIVAAQVNSYNEGTSLATCIAHGALMTGGVGVASAFLGLAAYVIRREF